MLSELIFFTNKVSSRASKELKALVLSSMQNDDITDIVREDELITTLGSPLTESQVLRKDNLISQKMRLLGRLLQELRAKEEDCLDLMSFLSPKYFDDIIGGTKKTRRLQNNWKGWGKSSFIWKGFASSKDVI